MSKKLITACMALVALAAFALPAVAMASPEVTHPTGTRLATGTKITATNVGVSKFVGGGITVECNNNNMTGTLTKNNGTEVEGTIESAHFTGTGGAPTNQCTTNSILGNVTVTTNVGNGTPWCVKLDSAEMVATIRGNSCANAARSITFVLDTAIGQCKYERTTATGPFKGTYNTHPEDAVISLVLGTNSAVVPDGANPFGCPSSGQLEMKFTMETDSETAEPLYIS